MRTAQNDSAAALTSARGAARAPGHGLRLRAAAAWGVWAQAVFALIAVGLWPIVVLGPTRSWARSAARCGARAWFLATGTRIRVRGLEGLDELRTPCVFVSNHTSKLDGIAMLAVLPFPFAFVAKVELQRRAWLRWPLRRFGVLFVRRDGARGGMSQTSRAIERLRAGDSLLWFPEGTVLDRPGLLAFHRGAFVAAAMAGTPVVPIALRGARALLPDPHRLPRRGAIEIDVGAPIEPPAGDRGSAALVLRDRARAFVAERCGEPDLGCTGCG